MRAGFDLLPSEERPLKRPWHGGRGGEAAGERAAGSSSSAAGGRARRDGSRCMTVQSHCGLGAAMAVGCMTVALRSRCSGSSVSARPVPGHLANLLPMRTERGEALPLKLAVVLDGAVSLPRPRAHVIGCRIGGGLGDAGLVERVEDAALHRRLQGGSGGERGLRWRGERARLRWRGDGLVLDGPRDELPPRCARGGYHRYGPFCRRAQRQRRRRQGGSKASRRKGGSVFPPPGRTGEGGRRGALPVLSARAQGIGAVHGWQQGALRLGWPSNTATGAGILPLLIRES